MMACIDLCVIVGTRLFVRRGGTKKGHVILWALLAIPFEGKKKDICEFRGLWVSEAISSSASQNYVCVTIETANLGQKIRGGKKSGELLARGYSIFDFLTDRLVYEPTRAASPHLPSTPMVCYSTVWGLGDLACALSGYFGIDKQRGLFSLVQSAPHPHPPKASDYP